MRPHVRVTLVVAIATSVVVAAALPSAAAGVWDANDTEGRLDIRWVGARYTSEDLVRFTLVMYPNFRRRALPGENLSSRRQLGIHFDAYTSGYYFRKNGRIKLAYGDHGSGCCEVVTVRRTSRTTLVARVHPYPWGDEGDPGALVYATSEFRTHDDRHRDVTRQFRLPPIT